MRISLLMTIVIFWFIAGCSSGGNVSEKALPDNDFVTPHEASTIPEQGDLYDEDVLINMQDMIGKTVYNYYYCNGRVPETYGELLNSGFLFSIPRCPYNNEFYSEGDSISAESPSVFNYYQLSDKTYGYEFIVMKNGELSKYVDNMDNPDSWANEALVKEKGEYADAKVQALMSYMPDILKQFYKKHERLPLTPQELFVDSKVIQAGWQKNPQGDFDKAYFEFGVDNVNDRYYIKYKYTFGASSCFSWAASSLSPEASFLSMEEINKLRGRFKFDEVPSSDYLVMNKWFDFNSIESFYDLIK